jgi:cytochrome c-type biogenesis protein CcmH/NrfG
MKAESVVFAIGGMVFGLVVGWVIGDQQAKKAGPVPVVAAAPAAPQSNERPVPQLDETQAQSLMNVANADAKNVEVRVKLGKLYLDAERFADAVKWYEQAVALDPKNVEASTELGESYLYTNQTDRALKQFEYSLKIDPKHVKTLINQGAVYAYGKQDFDAAERSWQKVVDLAPGTTEAQMAQRAIESLKTMHQGGAPAPGS